MPTPVPEPTLDLAAGTLIDLARTRYDAAWHQALLTDGPPPDRESFLAGVGPERGVLASYLDTIDGAYLRLRELIRTGAATMSPVGPVTNAPAGRPPAPTPSTSQFAETLDPAAAGRQPDAEESHSSQYAETLDSAPGGGAEARPQPAAPLGAGVAVGGYELLGVIAHGGMGVVYKARHTRLDRLAAIKMILAGAHASADHFNRFRAESQVVARLQHPNVVQLYEVGDQDNLPYIALEFVDGGSLANKAGGRPQPPREAAAVVEVLARAMAYAHQKGVVHRDLKPANVLLTADGVPKVTDFGLAKRLEGDSGQTRSGTLMGTPSYMAPEQAAGWTHAVGPLTDVYALGAVLYELLTGRPPFTAGSPLETVVAVLKTDPVAPTRLQPAVPRDLETICLKCLEKEPPKRYQSAADLAEDLRRFLAGEAIRARPVGKAERLWRWGKRNPGVASLSAAVLLLLTAAAAGATTAALRIRAEKQTAEANAVAAREAQTWAEDARTEAERQTGIAEQNAAAARTAQAATAQALKQTEAAKARTDEALKIAEAARTEAEKARARADASEAAAAEQLDRALKTLGDFVTTVQTRLDNSPGTQQVKKDLLELALRELRAMSGTVKKGATDIRMAEGYRRLGDLAQRLGDLPLARQQYEEMERVAREQTGGPADDTNRKRALSQAEVRLGDLCALGGDRAGARRYYEAARKLRAGPGGAAPDGVDARRDYAQLLDKFGDISDPGPAVELYKEALGLREELFKARPTDGTAARDVRVSNYKLADAYLKKGDPAAARPHAQRAVAIAESLAKANQKVSRLRVDVALARAKLGDVYRAEGRADDAVKQYEDAARLTDPLAAQNPQDLVLQVTHALFLAHAGRHAAAAELAARVREQAPQNAFLLYNAACVYAVAAEEAAGAKPAADLTPEDRKLIDGYGAAALACLKAALAAGFADHALIRTDPELAAVRKLPGFAEVAKGLR